MNKTRLEREIDSLPIDTNYRERKIHDMTLRLDSMYDIVTELEERIEETKLKKQTTEMQAITLGNIYNILKTFNKLYDIMDEEKKEFDFIFIRIMKK